MTFTTIYFQIKHIIIVFAVTSTSKQCTPHHIAAAATLLHYYIYIYLQPKCLNIRIYKHGCCCTICFFYSLLQSHTMNVSALLASFSIVDINTYRADIAPFFAHSMGSEIEAPTCFFHLVKKEARN